MPKRPKRRHHSHAADAGVVAGVGWYDSVQWAKLKQIADDADKLDDSYEAWLLQAEHLQREMARRGIKLERVPINVYALVKWCQANGKPVDGTSRGQYTSEILSGAGGHTG
jgi:hypothetical protein